MSASRVIGAAGPGVGTAVAADPFEPFNCTSTASLPSNAIDCAASGTVTVGDISLSPGGEEIFKQGRSLIWKSLRVNRIYDAGSNALIYLGHARELQQGSGKMSLSVIPLNGEQVIWSNGAPATP